MPVRYATRTHIESQGGATLTKPCPQQKMARAAIELHPVAAIRCQVLPPARTEKMARYFAEQLEEPEVCRPGLFPIRYGSGKDLPRPQACVRMSDPGWDPPAEGGSSLTTPIGEHVILGGIISALVRVQPCPPGTEWYSNGAPPFDGFGVPTGITLDHEGNLYVADWKNGTIRELAAGDQYRTIRPFGSDLGYPTAIAVAGSGDVFVVAEGRDDPVPVDDRKPFGWKLSTPPPELREVLAADGYNTIRTLSISVGRQSRIALDSKNDLFIAAPEEGTISRALASDGYASVEIIGRGFDHPSAIAVDRAGNVFFVEAGAGVVKELRADASDGYGAPVIAGPATQATVGLAIDAAGNIFLAEDGGPIVGVIEILAGTSPAQSKRFYEAPPSGIGFGIHMADVAVDRRGNVIFIECGFSRDGAGCQAKVIPAGQDKTAVKSLPPGLSIVSGLALDNQGNIFVADDLLGRPEGERQHGVVKEIPAEGGYAAVKLIGGGLSKPFGVAAAPNGDLFASDPEANAVFRLHKDGATMTISPIGQGLTTPTNLVSDSKGNIFVVDLTGEDYAPVSRLSRIEAASDYTKVETLKLPLDHIAGLAIDASDNLFAAGTSPDQLDGSLTELTATSRYADAKAIAANGIEGVAIDAAGTAYTLERHVSLISGQSDGTIESGTITKWGMSANRRSPVPLIADTSTYSASCVGDNLERGVPLGRDFIKLPCGAPIAADGVGDLFVFDFVGNAVMELSPGDGYKTARHLGIAQ